jgi:hypothetical protein
MAEKKTPLPYTGKEFLDSLDDGREVWWLSSVAMAAPRAGDVRGRPGGLGY